MLAMAALATTTRRSAAEAAAEEAAEAKFRRARAQIAEENRREERFLRREHKEQEARGAKCDADRLAYYGRPVVGTSVPIGCYNPMRAFYDEPDWLEVATIHVGPVTANGDPVFQFGLPD